MICQIESIKTKTEALPAVNKGLLQIRHIQGRLHEEQASKNNQVGSPMPAGPFMVPIIRWIE